jgi:hypothetical protein
MSESLLNHHKSQGFYTQNPHNKLIINPFKTVIFDAFSESESVKVKHPEFIRMVWSNP